MVNKIAFYIIGTLAIFGGIALACFICSVIFRVIGCA